MIFRGNINGINCQFGGLFMTKRAFYGKTVSFLAVWLTGRDGFKVRGIGRGYCKLKATKGHKKISGSINELYES